MSSPEYDMALYLQNHKVPYLIDEMIIGMEKSRPQDVLSYMKKWIDDKQKTGGHTAVLPNTNIPQLTDAEKKELASFMPPGMGMLRRTGTVMEPSKVRDRSKGVALVTSELKHAAEIDISGKEDSMVGAKRMNGIICTIGPASDNVPTLIALMRAGLNIARLNFSHGSYESHTKTVNNVREAAKQAGRLIALALDTKGPEIRTGTRAGYVAGTAAIDIEYKAGTVVKVSSNPDDRAKCDETLMQVDYLNMPKVVEVGGKIFVDDGLLQLEITETGTDYVLISVADGIMVARGDLGIEIPPEKVFIAQKYMISNCNLVGKPVVCATQMLETMTKNPRPTRAEVSDVCNAVLEGADCTMLSGETAKGKYPIEAVETMAKCGLQAQCALSMRSRFEDIRRAMVPPLPAQEVVAQSAVNTAFEICAAGIVVLSNTGKSARLLSKYRPHCPIFAVTHVPKNARQLNLSRGVFSVLTDEPKDKLDYDARIQAGINYGKLNGDLFPGDHVVVMHSDGNRPDAGANLVRVIQVR
uniref:pyruvate kinase n=1 Tax=Eutreptiella gymnastica TaxID=73025 RepID=A0A7S1N125_9EUGL|mmetsp:Transcript_103464/g.178244  ORF Transcript_103464/g.178244 Transcript_103464/m.178244 type:complete len:526 (+) Transcript_103464:160-1737(+)